MQSNYFKFNSRNPIIVICLSIFPISLITGPLIPEILIFLINVLFIINLKKIKFSKKEKKILFFLFVWWVYLVLNSLFSSEIFYSLKSTIFYFRYILFASAIYFFYLKNISSIKYLLFSIMFCFSILIIDSLFQFFLGKNILGYTKYGLVGNYEVVRLGSLFGDELILGSYLSKFLFFFILISLFFKEFENKIFLLIFCPLAIFVIFLSGERQAFYSTLIFLVLLFSIINNKNIFIFLNFIFFILLLTLFVLPSNSNIYKRMLNPIENIQNVLIDLTSKDTDNSIKNFDNITIFSAQHTSHYKVAIAMFKDEIFFGKGPNTFRKLCSKKKYNIYLSKNQNGCSTHPHNLYIQSLAEIGIFGFLVLFCFFIYIILKFLKLLCINIFNKNYNKTFIHSKIIVCANLIMLLNPIMTNGNFFNNYLNIVYFYIISLNFIILNNSNLIKKLQNKKFRFF